MKRQLTLAQTALMLGISEADTQILIDEKAIAASLIDGSMYIDSREVPVRTIRYAQKRFVKVAT